MTVKELSKELKKMPSSAKVRYHRDGGAYSTASHVWLARDGFIVISDGDVCYNTGDRPKDAPTERKNRYWHPGSTLQELKDQERATRHNRQEAKKHPPIWVSGHNESGQIGFENNVRHGIQTANRRHG